MSGKASAYTLQDTRLRTNADELWYLPTGKKSHPYVQEKRRNVSSSTAISIASNFEERHRAGVRLSFAEHLFRSPKRKIVYGILGCLVLIGMMFLALSVNPGIGIMMSCLAVFLILFDLGIAKMQYSSSERMRGKRIVPVSGIASSTNMYPYGSTSFGGTNDPHMSLSISASGKVEGNKPRLQSAKSFSRTHMSTYAAEFLSNPSDSDSDVESDEYRDEVAVLESVSVSRNSVSLSRGYPTGPATSLSQNSTFNRPWRPPSESANHLQASRSVRRKKRNSNLSRKGGNGLIHPFIHVVNIHNQEKSHQQVEGGKLKPKHRIRRSNSSPLSPASRLRQLRATDSSPAPST